MLGFYIRWADVRDYMCELKVFELLKRVDIPIGVWDIPDLEHLERYQMQHVIDFFTLLKAVLTETKASTQL
jgi:hypothetical protein